MASPDQPDGQSQSGNDFADAPDRWAQRIGMALLGGAALACVAGVVLVVVHHSTGSTTAAITAMSSLGSAAVGGIAGMLTISGHRPSPATQTASGPVPAPGISLNPTSGAANTSLTITGSGFSTGETIALAFGATPLSAATADGNGSFSQPSTVPALARAAYTVTATGQSSASVAAAQFTIL